MKDLVDDDIEAYVTDRDADVLVEFFTGSFGPSGCLEPKRMLERWLTPPYSLCFNLLVNPFWQFSALVAQLSVDDPRRIFRLVVWLWFQRWKLRVAPGLCGVFGPECYSTSPL